MAGSPSHNVACEHPDRSCQQWHEIASAMLRHSQDQCTIYTLGGPEHAHGDAQQAHMVAAFHRQDPQDRGQAAARGAPSGILDSQFLHRDAWTPISGPMRQTLKDMLAAFEQEHPAFLHIDYICVRPGHQGRGLGSQLLRHALAAADEAGLPSYLETLDRANVALYSRHGFTVLQTQEFGYPWTSRTSCLYSMGRPARPAGAAGAVP